MPSKNILSIASRKKSKKYCISTIRENRIGRIAKKFKTERHFSLYLIELDKMPSQSIQVIDQNKVIIINTLKKAGVDKKHIFIDSEECNKIYHGLYNDIVEKSITIIENGVLNSANFNKYLK